MLEIQLEVWEFRPEWRIGDVIKLCALALQRMIEKQIIGIAFHLVLIGELIWVYEAFNAAAG